MTIERNAKIGATVGAVVGVGGYFVTRKVKQLLNKNYPTDTRREQESLILRLHHEYYPEYLHLFTCPAIGALSGALWFVTQQVVNDISDRTSVKMMLYAGIASSISLLSQETVNQARRARP